MYRACTIRHSCPSPAMLGDSLHEFIGHLDAPQLSYTHDEFFTPGKGKVIMPVTQGDLALLQHPAAQELLESKIPARLAYVWTDGSPRVIPIWFHWNGSELVMGTPPKAPKLKALAKDPRVSLTIDDNTFPHKVLLVRGTARMEPVNGVVPEYALAAERYFGREQGQAWVAQMGNMVSSMVRVTITPEWVGLLDFQTRFPSALPL